MSNGGRRDRLTPFLETMLGVLRRLATAGDVVTYEELEILVKEEYGSCSPYWQIGGHLGTLSHWEADRGRPMISAIVVNRDDSVGPGFWTMVEDERGIRVPDHDEYLAEMQRSVWRYWAP